MLVIRPDPERGVSGVDTAKGPTQGPLSFSDINKNPQGGGMSEFLVIATASTLVGALIYLLLGTVRASLASHEGEE